MLKLFGEQEKGLDVVLYLTVGTGLGGGLYIHGRPLHGLNHPEMGHVIVSQDKQKDPFPCSCPYHENCLEGLASGRAVDLRWKCHASELPDDHPAWELEADYLAQGILDYILTVSPEKVILGGGLMKKKDPLSFDKRKSAEQTSRLHIRKSHFRRNRRLYRRPKTREQIRHLRSHRIGP